MSRQPSSLSPSPASVQAADERLSPTHDALRALARDAAGGNPDAAGTLVTHVGGGMLNIVRRVLGRAHADVDDVTQDAVIALLDALGSFRGESSVAHFANRIALLTALGARRRLGVRLRWSETQEVLDDLAAREHSSPLATALASRRRELLRQLLDELPEVIAEALALHFVLGYTVEEIAASAQVPSNTVWSRLRLGKRALKRKLDQHAELAELFEGPT